MTPAHVNQPARTPVGAALDTSGPVRAWGCAELNHVISGVLHWFGCTGARQGRLRRIVVPAAFLPSPETGGGFRGPRIFSRFKSIAASSLASMGKRVSALYLLGAAPRLKFIAHISNQLPGYLPDAAHIQPFPSFAGFDGANSRTKENQINGKADQRRQEYE